MSNPGSTHRTWKSPTANTVAATPINTRPNTSEIGSNACRCSPSHMAHLHVTGTDTRPQHQPLDRSAPSNGVLTAGHDHAWVHPVMFGTEHVHLSNGRTTDNVCRDAVRHEHLELAHGHRGVDVHRAARVDRHIPQVEHRMSDAEV